MVCTVSPSRSRNSTVKVCAAAGVAEVDEPHVGLRVLAVGDDAAVLDAADQPLHDRMIGAHHGEAVERHVLDEGAEGVLHRLRRS